MTDLIDNLPTDTTPLTPSETSLLNMLNPPRNNENNPNKRANDINIQEVQRTANVLNKAFWGLKDIIIASVLFAIISLPYTDKIIDLTGMINAESYWKKLGVKIAVFAIVLFCVLNFNLARK